MARDANGRKPGQPRIIDFCIHVQLSQDVMKTAAQIHR